MTELLWTHPKTGNQYDLNTIGFSLRESAYAPEGLS
jgi:hypothetical protein